MTHLINLLRADGSIIINKKLARKIGLHETIMYSELLSKYCYFLDNDRLDDDGYFYCTTESMENATTLTRHQQPKIAKKLEKLGLIEMKIKGVPAKKYYKIVHNEDLLKDLLSDDEAETSMPKIGKLEKKRKTSSPKIGNLANRKTENSSNNNNIILDNKSTSTSKNEVDSHPNFENEKKIDHCGKIAKICHDEFCQNHPWSNDYIPDHRTSVKMLKTLIKNHFPNKEPDDIYETITKHMNNYFKNTYDGYSQNGWPLPIFIKNFVSFAKENNQHSNPTNYGVNSLLNAAY
jgi:hypothetical protein